MWRCAKAYTIAKALHWLQNGTLQFGHLDLVIVDEAGMVGTHDLRQLLTATTRANAKTVLVGDARQLAPVKARGGMFAQLRDDLALARPQRGSVAHRALSTRYRLAVFA
jgi:ATP-dependent exoDNAse (exonuclease V) alpha subunit